MKLVVTGGVCGFTSCVETLTEDMRHVSFRIESDCANVRRLAEALGEVDAYAEYGAKFDGDIDGAVRTAGLCSGGCLVPAALHKACQVAAGLALPAAASMEFVE